MQSCSGGDTNPFKTQVPEKTSDACAGDGASMGSGNMQDAVSTASESYVSEGQFLLNSEKDKMSSTASTFSFTSGIAAKIVSLDENQEVSGGPAANSDPSKIEPSARSSHPVSDGRAEELASVSSHSLSDEHSIPSNEAEPNSSNVMMRSETKSSLDACSDTASLLQQNPSDLSEEEEDNCGGNDSNVLNATSTTSKNAEVETHEGFFKVEELYRKAVNLYNPKNSLTELPHGVTQSKQNVTQSAQDIIESKQDVIGTAPNVNRPTKNKHDDSLTRNILPSVTTNLRQSSEFTEMNTPKISEDNVNPLAADFKASSLRFSAEENSHESKGENLFHNAADQKSENCKTEGEDGDKISSVYLDLENTNICKDTLFDLECNKPHDLPEIESNKPPNRPEVECNKPHDRPEVECNKPPNRPEVECNKPHDRPEVECNKPHDRPEVECNKPHDRPEVECNKPPNRPEVECNKPHDRPEVECNKPHDRPEVECNKPHDRPEVECNKPPNRPEVECNKPHDRPEVECNKPPNRPEVECNKPPNRPEVECNKPHDRPEVECNKPHDRPEVECNKPHDRPEVECNKPHDRPEVECNKPHDRPEVECNKPHDRPEVECNKPHDRPECKSLFLLTLPEEEFDALKVHCVALMCV